MKTIEPFAQFWRCDLQTHSPLEHEFSPGVDTTNAAAVKGAAEKFVKHAVDAGLDAVAITDHNSVAFIRAVTQAAADKLVVFPGVEISASDGYHLLAIFEPGTDPDRIQALLTKLGIEKGTERTTQNAPTCAEEPWTWGKILEEIDKRDDAIAIAPHVRRSKGILRSGVAGEVRARYWKSPHLYVVEDNKKELRSGSSMTDNIMLNELDDYRRDRLPARIWGSDSKSYDAIGERSTYIKMVEPSIEGLRQAFLDPGSRVRHPDGFEIEARDRILGMTWEAGFLGDQQLRLSDQLSCLIGGKGTGKSTVVESLRFVFQMEHEKGPLATQYEKLVESALPPGTRVTVEVARRDGGRYSLTRTAPYDTEVLDADGSPVELDPADLLEVTILSQGEILEIARQPSSHLALLNSFIDDELAPLRAQERDLVVELEQNRGRLVEDLDRSERLAEDQAEIRRLEAAKKTFDKKGVSERTELRRKLDREEQLVQKALGAANEVREALAELQDLEAPPELVTDKDLPNRKIWVELEKEWKEAAKRLAELRTKADEAFASVATRIEDLTASGSEWAQSVSEKREDVSGVYRELQEQYPDLDLAQFDRLDRDLERLGGKVEARSGAEDVIKTHETQRKELLRDLRQNRREQYAIREALAKRLNEQLAGSVRVEVEFLGDRESVLSQLTDLRTGVRREALQAIATHADFTPELIGQALLDGPEAVVTAFGVTKGQATTLVEKMGAADKFRLQELAVSEQVSIKFNLARDNEEARYRGLSQLSVGQKATCILLILLAQKERPLVIDQPEDDLDNRFIYADVVERLRDVKDHRQLLLSTHNANIPVLGDGELIAVLETRESGGRAVGTIAETGSIDSPQVKLAVTQILEGGRRAFQRRQEKYGLPIPDEIKDAPEGS